MSVLKVVVPLLATWTAVAFGAQTARITVNPDAIIGPVNRLILGNNMLAYQRGRDEYGNRGAGIWDPENRRPVPEYVALARESGMTVARWPGG
ncbi:MAG: hypothetical protein ACE5O2_03895, partial [Armatimonadota bacterium]